MECLIEEIDFGYSEEELKTINKNKLEKEIIKENIWKKSISRTKENKLKFKELMKDLYRYDFCHPTLNIIYNFYLYAERFENQKRKKRNRKGLINKNKFNLKYLLK